MPVQQSDYCPKIVISPEHIVCQGSENKTYYHYLVFLWWPVLYLCLAVLHSVVLMEREAAVLSKYISKVGEADGCKVLRGTGSNNSYSSTIIIKSRALHVTNLKSGLL